MNCYVAESIQSLNDLLDKWNAEDQAVKMRRKPQIDIFLERLLELDAELEKDYE